MSLRPGITALVTAHPARFNSGLLARALTYVCRQQLQPDHIIVVNDKDRRGAGATRDEALRMVQTQWFAWVDSDDYWYPSHLLDLYTCAQETGAKYVFSWFDGRGDPLGHFGKTFDVHNPHHTTITALIDTEIAQSIGYPETDHEGQFSNEDWAFIVKFAEHCVNTGDKMVHLPKRTWYWEQANQNTSGKPGQGDAR